MTRGAALAAAIERDPGRPEAHNALGVAYAGGGRLEEARHAFEAALAVDTASARVCNNLGNVLRDLGRGDEAEDAYQRAIALAPRYPDPFNGLGALEVAATGRRRRCRSSIAPWPSRRASTRCGSTAASPSTAGRRAAAAIAAYREFLSAAAGDPGSRASARRRTSSCASSPGARLTRAPREEVTPTTSCRLPDRSVARIVHILSPF